MARINNKNIHIGFRNAVEGDEIYFNDKDFKNKEFIFSIGDVFELMYDFDEKPLPGSKNPKKGKYLIIDINKSIYSDSNDWHRSYVFIKDQKNAKYKHSFSRNFIDALYELGYIRKISSHESI